MAKLSQYKGLHPGFFLEHELKKRNLPIGRFAISIGAFPQTLSAIAHGKRSMNIPLSMKIESQLGLTDGFLMTLQVHYDIKREREKGTQDIKPDLTKIRKGLFWDTDFEAMNWTQHRAGIIRRIMERGNAVEKQEIERFYGKAEIEKTMAQLLPKKKRVNKVRRHV